MATTITIGLPNGWQQRLERKARKLGISKGEFIRRKLKPFLEDDGSDDGIEHEEEEK